MTTWDTSRGSQSVAVSSRTSVLDGLRVCSFRWMLKPTDTFWRMPFWMLAKRRLASSESSKRTTAEPSPASGSNSTEPSWMTPRTASRVLESCWSKNGARPEFRNPRRTASGSKLRRWSYSSTSKDSVQRQRRTAAPVVHTMRTVRSSSLMLSRSTAARTLNGPGWGRVFSTGGSSH